MYLQINQKYSVYTLTVFKIITKEVVFFYKKKTQMFLFPFNFNTDVCSLFSNIFYTQLRHLKRLTTKQNDFSIDLSVTLDEGCHHASLLYSPITPPSLLAGLKVNNKPKSNASVERIALCQTQLAQRAVCLLESHHPVKLMVGVKTAEHIKDPQTRYDTIKTVIHHFPSLCRLA